MKVSWIWCTIIFMVIVTCTHGVQTTECGDIAQISFLTNLHEEQSCTKLLTKGVMLFEAAKLLTEVYNNKSDGFHIGITVLDTCGSSIGTLKAIMKALVWADINCLHPPHYLGIIGPDTMTNSEAVVEVTSMLQLPHIVRKSSSSYPYLHHLTERSNSHIVQGILSIIEILKWKSFTLIVDVHNKNKDGTQDVARKLMMDAIEKNLCVTLHDNDEKDYTSHVVYIGKPEYTFFNKLTNVTILIVSEENLKDYVNRANSTNTILLLEESRDEVFDRSLERRIEKSQWWVSESERAKYDAGQLKEVRWLEKAIGIYVRALNALCRHKKCKNQINLSDWNHAISNVLITQNAETQTAPRFLDLSMKTKIFELERLGGVIVRKNVTNIYWGERRSNVDMDLTKEIDDKANDENIPYAFRRFVIAEKKSITDCATTVKRIDMVHATDDEDETEEIFISEIDDSTEWWTTVCTASGVIAGIFLLGSLGVYVIYVNMQGSRRQKSRDHLDRDNSVRGIGNDKELPATITVRNQRVTRTPQRTESTRSGVSERSI